MNITAYMYRFRQRICGFAQPRPRDTVPADRPACLALFLALALGLGACSAAGHSSARYRDVPDPDGQRLAGTGAGFAVMALRYAPDGEAFDYSGAGFTPVLLVLKSTGSQQPQVLTEDVRALTPEGERPPYTPAEAARLAQRRMASGREATAAVKDGAVGAVVGGGVGALAGLLFGNGRDAVWKGAAVGAAAGGAYALITDRSQQRADRERAVSADLEAKAWREDPLAPGSTRTGYLYLPVQPGLASLRLIVRASAGDAIVTLPIVSPGRGDAGSAPQAPGGAALLPRVAPLDPATGREAQPAQAPGGGAASARREQPQHPEGAAPPPSVAPRPGFRPVPSDRSNAQQAEDESDDQAQAQADSHQARPPAKASRSAPQERTRPVARTPGTPPRVSSPPGEAAQGEAAQGETGEDGAAQDAQTPGQPEGVTI